MGVEKFLQEARRHSRISLDTVVLIYHVEDVRPYSSLTTALLDWIGEAEISLVLSTLIWTEMLVKPFQMRDEARAEQIEDFLRSIPKAVWIPPDEEIAREAARLRGTYGLKTPDAIIVATSLKGGASLLVTNDEDLKKVERERLRVVILDEWL